MKPFTFAVLVCGVGFENRLEVLEEFWKADGSELFRGTQCLRFLIFIVEVDGNRVVDVMGLQTRLDK